MVSIQTKVNGSEVSVEVNGAESAVEVIREQLGMTGTKLVCGSGVCGACTIQLDGEPNASCLTPATALDNRNVTTIEGIAADGQLHPVQKAFLANDGLQCGYCTPGFIVDAVAFVDRWRTDNGDIDPDREVIADALAGHLCRCGAYEGIYRAVAAACRGEADGELDYGRVDGPAKVTGAAVYTADRYPEGALEAVLVRSPIGAGVVGPLPDAASDSLVDLLGDDRTVRFAGQPIAAVAAPTRREAERLAAALPLQIDPLPFVTDPTEAKADDAPVVYPTKEAQQRAPSAAEGMTPRTRWSGNNWGPISMPFMARRAERRVRKARDRQSSELVELSVSMETQNHTAFEPHCTVADWSDPEHLIVWTSTQMVNEVAERLAEKYELRQDQIEVHAEFVGGGFGAKNTIGLDTIGAVELSRLTRRPVRLVPDRREELTDGGNRPGNASRISLVGDTSELKALTLDAESYSGTSIGSFYGINSLLMYGRSPRVARDVGVLTNAPPGAAFRGPGGPAALWALEQAVDQAAHQLDVDPLTLRRSWDGNERRQALYDWVSGLDVWRQRPATGSQSGRFRRGVGLAAANWLYMVDPATEVTVSVEDGRLVVTNATQDIGTGIKTLFARATAEVFGIDHRQVEVRAGRAGQGTPHGPMAGGSRSTPSVWSTTLEAATALRDEIGTDVGPQHNGASATRRRGGDRGIRPVPITMSGLQIGRRFPGAVYVSEVEVDTRTGKTRVLTVHLGMAVGKIHNRDLSISQCEGAVIQGIGLALYENQILDPHTGQTLTSNLEDYRIPQLGDMPEVTIHFHEEGWDHVPGGGVGLGEVSTIGQAPSIGNAIFNATDWRPTQSPVRPDRLLKGLA